MLTFKTLMSDRYRFPYAPFEDSRYHNYHHSHYSSSYGSFFGVWDRVLGTLDPVVDYWEAKDASAQNTAATTSEQRCPKRND